MRTLPLLQKLPTNEDFSEATFCGGDKDRKLTCHNRKMASPPSLEQKTTDWCHEMLCHPGTTRTEAAIRQHFDLKGLGTMVIATCKKRQLCQKAKLTNQKQGKLPAKLAEENPWDTLCVGLIGPCKIEHKGKKDLKLWCLAVIDPATGWFEMEQISNKTAAEVADIFETTWFTRHPLPQRITHDRGTEFMAEFAKMLKPLDSPSNVLDVLQGVLLIKEGVIGNNVTTGPLQHRHWRGCLMGAALDKFNEQTLAVGNETAANLHTVEQRLITFFAPREVLRQQTRHIRFHMRKPEEVSARQCVGAVATLNHTLSKLPPAFNDLEKVSDTDMMDILASKAPKGHKELMSDHGFDPQTATTAEFAEICERSETKEAPQTRKQSHGSDDDSSDDKVQHPKKPRSLLPATTREREIRILL
jgi:hypothetical protein